MSLNLKTTFKDKVSKPLAVGTLALSMAFAPMAANDAMAGDADTNRVASASKTSTQTTQKTPSQLIRTAMKYSRDNDAVGVFINVTPSGGFDPKELGGLIVKKFKEDGIQSAYIYNYASAGQSSISFYVRGVPYSGYGLGKLEEGYNLASTTIRAIQADDSNKMAMNELAAN